MNICAFVGVLIKKNNEFCQLYVCRFHPRKFIVRGEKNIMNCPFESVGSLLVGIITMSVDRVTETLLQINKKQLLNFGSHAEYTRNRMVVYWRLLIISKFTGNVAWHKTCFFHITWHNFNTRRIVWHEEFHWQLHSNVCLTVNLQLHLNSKDCTQYVTDRWTIQEGSQNVLEVTSVIVNRFVIFREPISCAMSKAYNQRLLAGKSGLDFRPVRVGFVVCKVSLGQKFLLIRRVSFDFYPPRCSILKFCASSTDTVTLVTESVIK